MDIFATLPTELITPILGNLPNLESLYNIARASPRISRFLDSPLGAAILDNILSSWGGSVSYELEAIDAEDWESYVKTRLLGTTPWVPHILRLIALVRHCSVTNQPADDLVSFVLRFIMPTESAFTGVPELLPAPPACIPIIRLQDVMCGSRAISPWEMLRFIRKTLVLTDECFHFLRERVETTKPRHLERKILCSGVPLLWGCRPDGQPCGQHYEIDAGGEASWYEYHRILLGFCCLQLRYELSNAVHEGRLRWSAQDVKAIRSMGTAEPCLPKLEKSELPLILELMWAAATYVAFLQGSPDEGFCVGNTGVEHGRRRAFFDTGFQPLKSERLQLPQPKCEDANLMWPTTVVRQPSSFGFRRDTFFSHCEVLLFMNKGVWWARGILHPQSGRSWTEGLLFRPLRRLGFGIWDDERLTQMEMIDDPEGKVDTPRRFHVQGENQAFTWASLLSPRELEELRAYQEVLRAEREQQQE